MREAVIVSAARTAVGRAKKGTLVNYRPEDMGAAAVAEAVRRVKGLDPQEIDDVMLGCAMPEGAQGLNVARNITLRAGLPHTVTAQTINRFCSSGLQTIALAAQQIMTGMGDVIVAGGVESMSAVPMTGFQFRPNPWLVDNMPEVYISMGLTAENVAEAFNVSREAQDEFSARSHTRALAAITAGKFRDEIVPLEVETVTLENGGPVTKQFVFDVDEGPRPGSTPEVLSRLKPVFKVNERRCGCRGGDVRREGREIGLNANGSLR
jgi:acetyl-CoA acyltransferase